MDEIKYEDLLARVENTGQHITCCEPCHFSWEENYAIPYLPKEVAKWLVEDHKRVMRGGMKPKDILKHAKEEMEHADMLANRIIELGGEPILNPVNLGKISNCGYEEPSKPMTKEILKQNIKGEQCAIGVYNTILDKLKGMNDAITYNMIRKILQDEVKHEQDLQDLQEDLNLMCNCKK